MVFITTTVDGMILSVDYGDGLLKERTEKIIPFLMDMKREGWKLTFVNSYKDYKGNGRFQYILEK